MSQLGFLVALVVKNPPANAGHTEPRTRSLGGEDTPGVGNGTPLQHSCPENAMDTGAWRATVHGAAKSQTRMSTHTHTQIEPVITVVDWENHLEAV